MRKLIALFALALVTLVLTGAYTPSTYTVIDLEGLGAVGDDSTINNAVFANAFATASAHGGMMRLPCGTFKITTTPTVNIGAGKHVGLVGSGDGCTIIHVAGAINGPTFNYGDQWSSANISDLTIETDQAGSTTCLVLTGAFVNPLSSYAAASFVERVTLRGTDIAGAWTKYCNVGLLDNSISNLTIDKLTYQGLLSSLVGTGVKIVGSGTGGTYAVAINIVNSVINVCSTAVSYGDWVQGVVVDKNNITGCQNGVIVAGSPSGSLSELIVSNTQINAYSCGVCVNATAFPNLQMINNVLIVEGTAIGVKVQGTNWSISGSNEFGGVSSQTNINSGSGTVGGAGAATITPVSMSASSLNFLPVVVPVPISKGSFILYDVGGAHQEGVVVTGVTGSTFTATFAQTHAAGVPMSVFTNQATGLLIGSTFGNGGLLAPTHFANFGVAIQVSAAQQQYAKIDSPLFVNNTTDYVIDASANGVLINDNMPRNFANLNNVLPCNSAIRYSIGRIADGNAGTFYAAAAGGGGFFLNVGCDGSTWHVM